MANINDLRNLFSWAFTLLTEDKSKGVTMSVAQQSKEANHNESVKILNDLEYNQAAIYSCKKVYYHNSGVQEVPIEPEQAPTPEMFQEVDKVADMYATSAIYGAGIKLKSDLIEQITNVDRFVLQEYLGLKEPKSVAYPIQKNALIRISMSEFTDKKNVDELIPYMSKDLLDKIGSDLITKALAVEARASVYGKQSADPKSFLRKISSATRVFRKGEEGMGQTVSTYTLAIDKEDYHEVDKELKDKHNTYQSEKNGDLKLIKDAARQLQREYEEAYSVALEDYRIQEEVVQNTRKKNAAAGEAFKTSLLEIASGLYIVNP